MWTITNTTNIFYDEGFQITKIFGFERYLKWDPYYICQQIMHRLSKVHLKYLFLLSYELEHCNNIEMSVKNQLQGMLAVFEPLDRAQSKKNFEHSFVKIGWRFKSYEHLKLPIFGQ